MKNLLKLSALAAVLVASATFASADTLVLGSYCASNPGCAAGTNVNTATVYNSTQGATAAEVAPGPGLPGSGLTNTFAVTSNPPWHAALGTSQWVSFEAGTGCCGGVVAPNDFYSYYSAFTLTGAAGDVGSISVLADDTTDVYLNGHLLSGEAGGPNTTCQTATPDCTTVSTFSLTPWLSNGVNVLEFDVAQLDFSATGLDFSGSIAPSAVPEPSTLLMLGTGLVGSAGALFRRMRK